MISMTISRSDIKLIVVMSGVVYLLVWALDIIGLIFASPAIGFTVAQLLFGEKRDE